MKCVLALSFIIWLTSLPVDTVPYHQEFKRDELCLEKTTSTLIKNTRTRIECMTKCVADVECMGISYDTSDKSCYTSNTYQLTDCTSTADLTYRALGVCPQGYIHNPHTDTCFHLFPTVVTRAEAQTHCQNLGEHLVTLDSLVASQWLRQKMTELAATNSDWAAFLWIGGYDTNGQYEWQGVFTGNVPTKGTAEADWCCGEPNRSDEKCMFIGAAGWFDVNCAGQYAFMCEKRIN